MTPQDKARELREQLQAHYKGPSEIVDAFLAAALSHGKIMLYSSHGKGKSLLAETFSKLGGVSYARVQGSVGLMESRLIARYDIASLMKGKEEIKWRDFVTAKIKHLDEINRTPPVLLNAIFSMLQERRVQFGDEWIDLDGFTFIGTMNPADSATYELPPPLIDRFDICILLPSVKLSEKHALTDFHDTKPVLEGTDLEEIRKGMEAVEIGADINTLINSIVRDLQLCVYSDKEFITDFPQCCGECRHKEWICSKMDGRFAASERIGLSLRKTSRSYAYLQGKKKVEKGDVLLMLKYVLYHRIRPIPSFSAKHHSMHAAIESLVSSLVSRDAERIDAFKLIKEIYYGSMERMDDLKEFAKNDMLINELYLDMKDKFSSQQDQLLGSLKGKTPEELEQIKFDLAKKDPKKYAKVIDKINNVLAPLLSVELDMQKDSYISFIARYSKTSPAVCRLLREKLASHESGSVTDHGITTYFKHVGFTAPGDDYWHVKILSDRLGPVKDAKAIALELGVLPGAGIGGSTATGV